MDGFNNLPINRRIEWPLNAKNEAREISKKAIPPTRWPPSFGDLPTL